MIVKEKDSLLIEVERWHQKEKYTIGKMYLNGVYFCDTCEDTDRGLYQHMPIETITSKKVYGETAIPKGMYHVSLTQSAKFGRKLPYIEDVPGYEGVRIHAGNTAKDSLGCILVGKNNIVGGVSNSRKTEDELMSVLGKVKGEIYIAIR